MTMWTPELGKRPGPRYLAIAEALAEDAARGRLRPGARLPTHRELADRLGITVGTVTRAYAEAARRGLLSGEVGRGTFLRAAEGDFAPLPAPASDAGVIEMGVNHPPMTAGGEVAERLASTLGKLAGRKDLERLLGYPAEGGAPEHREAGAAWIRRSDLQATPERVVVSSGSQHGMTAVFAALLRPGDLVLTEALTYPGMKALAGLLHLRLQGLPMDAHGLRPEALDEACRSGAAKALYCVPTIQNPTGSVMPEERRREVAAIARRHGLLVIEDDVHGLLPARRPRPLTAFLPDATIYLTGTAKAVAPGLRIGYMLAPPTLVPRLAAGIRATTWMAAPLMAEIASLWVRDGTAEAILKKRRAEAAARQELARKVLGRFAPAANASAYHLWLSLPEAWRSESFADEARRRGVAVTPAAAFAVGRSAAPPAVRVCLGPPADRAVLERGLRILAGLLENVPEAGFPVGP